MNKPSPEPHPLPSSDLTGYPLLAKGTEAQVCADIARRQAHGLAKYGVSVRDNPLTLCQWLQHAYEEHLDAAVYLKRALEVLNADAGKGPKPGVPGEARLLPPDGHDC